MITWHGKRCTKVDISLAGHIPYCAKCDNIAPSDFNTSPLSGPPTIPYSSQGGLNLTWPSSVTYSTGSIIQEDASTPYLAPHITDSEQHKACELQTDLSGRQLPAHGYESLGYNDKIRLLRLEKGTGEDPLHGDLVSAALKDPIIYEAVSYVWADDDGDTTRNRPLYLGERWEILLITKNCEATIRRLRLTGEDRILWIDAVCINQTDVYERSQQVGLMSQIYSTARACLVYIGEHRDNSEMAMRLIDRDHLPQELPKEMSIALSNLFKRPYFSRTWILQELVLSSKAIVHCGKSTTNWLQVISKPWDRYPAIDVPSWVKNFEICRYRQALDFPRWIFEMSSTVASDYRDKIFAILGLFRGLENDGLIPDYSLSTAQVYTGVASYLLLKHDMKHIISINKTLTAGLPSWVPDWRHVKSTQWDANAGSFEQVPTQANRRPELIQKQLLDIPNIFNIYWKNQSCQRSSPIEVVRETGGLLIWPHCLILTDSFVTSLNPTTFELTLDQEASSNGLDSTHGDYVGSFAGNEYLLLLRKISNNEIYRIVGRCSLSITLGQNRRFVEAKAILESVKRYINTKKMFDPVRYWVSRTWSRLLWTVYTDVKANNTTYEGANMHSIEAAFNEYMSLRRSYVSPGELYRLFVSRSDSVNGPCPGAKKLIECIRFWSNSNIWASVVYLRRIYLDQSFGPVSCPIKDWAELQRYREMWLHQKNMILPRPNILPAIIVPGFTESLIRRIQDYSRCLRQIVDITLDGSRKLPKDLYLVRMKKIIASARLIQEMISCFEQKLNLEEKDFLMSMTEEPSHEENLERYCWSVVMSLTEMVQEELDHTPLLYENTEDKETIYSQFESMYKGHLQDWLDLLGTVEKKLDTEGYSICSIKSTLKHIGEEFNAFHNSMKFGEAGDSSALGSFDTSSIADAIYDWVDGFENVYAETRKFFQTYLEAILHSRPGTSVNSTLDVEIVANVITRILLNFERDQLRATECEFIQSIIDIWTASEERRKIMII
ncbi:HET-domain-containing protein [Hypoxylon sp. EC38]|nr:HET-domain-containing protein [Hypoxylon sp. EC38]